MAVQQDQCIWSDLDMYLADHNAHRMAGCLEDGEIAWLKSAPPVTYNGQTRTAAVHLHWFHKLHCSAEQRKSVPHQQPSLKLTFIAESCDLSSI